MTKEEEAKLMYGMLFSIKSFVSKISPTDIKEGFLCYKTSKYTLHYLEIASGLKFVINTDNNAQGVRELLQQIYSQIYVEYVVKNPLTTINQPIQSDLFKTKLDNFVKASAHATEIIPLGQTPTGVLHMDTGKCRQRLDVCGVYGRIFFSGPDTEKQSVV
ncbi:hypothetical protein Trydic_g21615 [Trypoxylus dichotomus]